MIAKRRRISRPTPNIRPDEVTLSRIIADFLDPKGAHGQDDVYLRAYLDLIGLHSVDVRGVRVIREAFILSSGRADDTARRGFIGILIEGRDWRVAIENKPWAGDQYEQLARYWDHITKDRSREKCRLIYLSSGGKAPEPHSLPRAERETLAAEGLFVIQSLGAPQDDEASEQDKRASLFGDVLKTWAQATRPYHVRRFLEETATYLDTHFGRAEAPSMTETGPLVEFINSDRSMIEAAFHVEAALKDVRASVHRQFFETLKRKLDEQEWVEKVSPRGERISDRPGLKYAGASYYPRIASFINGAEWAWPSDWIAPRFELEHCRNFLLLVHYPDRTIDDQHVAKIRRLMRFEQRYMTNLKRPTQFEKHNGAPPCCVKPQTSI